ncbi:MAG: site-specific integrase [Phycisphaerales bacterium]|nr:site-specific integrase [Phycisphaerales bacterium]
MGTTRSTKSRIPMYRLHKPSGRAVVRLNGRDVYLGKYDTAESRAQYDAVIADWLAGSRIAASGSSRNDATVSELVLAFLNHAERYYIKNGQPTGETDCLRFALRPLVELHGRTRIGDFGPLSLKAVRDRMIAQGLARGTINARVNRVRRMFKWGVENQLVDPGILHTLQAVAPLKRGRSKAREVDPVRAVDEAIVQRVAETAPPVIAAMIRLQLYTGMRPGEVIQMRTRDIDRKETIWVYRPGSHKTEHHGRDRVIFIGPRAQCILEPMLLNDPDAYLFSPRRRVDAFHEQRRETRATPMPPSQASRTRKRTPRKLPGEKYTTRSYAQAVKRACCAAFPHPTLSAISQSTLAREQRKELAQWNKSHRFSPNQLRHTAATRLRREFDLETARVVLGHGSAAVTEVYAERDLSLAARVMAEAG